MNTTIKKRIEEINSGRVPEGYEKTSFGIFPCDWENKKFQQICDIFSGGTPNTNVREYWDGDIPWCVPTDITSNSKYIWQTERNITRLGLDNSSSIVMPENSILMCSRATIGPRCINKVPMATNQGFKNLVCKKGYEYEFIYYYIDILLKNLLKKSNGSTFLELSKSELEKSECVVPNNKEQSRIAEILTQWDKAIELQEKYIKQLELRKKALMQRLLTPKEGWTCKPLGYYFYKEKGKNVAISVEGKKPIIDMDYAINNREINFSNDLSGVFALDNEIIILWDGASAGKVLYGIKGIVGSTFCVLRQVNKVNSKYVYFYLDYAYEKNKKTREGSGIPHMPKDFLKKQAIWSPENILEQNKIANILTQADNEISLQTQKLDKLIKQRKALQQYLLTGIVRV